MKLYTAEVIGTMTKYQGYTEAQARANAAYDSKTYKVMTFKLRLEEDADIIEAIQAAQAKGINKREWLRDLFDNQK